MAARGWDRQVIAEVLKSNVHSTNDRSMTNSQQREADRKHQTWERHKFRRDYLVDEGWLDVLDQNGDAVLSNAFMVHCHGKVPVKPMDAPVWATDLTTGRRKWPFIAGAPIGHPARFEGRGILEADEGLALLLANTLNLMADGMNWLVNPDTELYQRGLVDWDDTAEYPGKLWLKDVKDQILTRAQRGEIRVGEVLAFLNYVDQLRQNTNFVTDFVVGLPGTRTNITKGETEIRTAQGMGMFDAIGKNLEHAGRVFVELTWDHLVQYLGGNDYANPSLVRILGPDRAALLSRMSLAERIAHLQGNTDFTFTGVSAALMKADQLNKVMQFGTLAATPYYAGRTDPTQVLRLLAELLGVNDRIDIYTPAPAPMPGARSWLTM